MIVTSGAVVFNWKVTGSFGAGHQITIPKRLHKGMREYGLDGADYQIIYPKGEVCTATMNHGRHDQPGEFYQLSVSRTTQMRPDYLKYEDDLIVMLVRTRRQNYAILEYGSHKKV